MQLIAAITAAAALWVATAIRISNRVSPHFQVPETVMDNVSATPHPTRTALILLPKIEARIPTGAAVTVFEPQDGHAQNDHTNYLTAVGLLPDHFVLPPFAASAERPRQDLVEYVIAVNKPFHHPHYDLVARFPEGALYKIRR